MTPNAAIALVANGRWGDYKRWLATVSPEAAYESIKLVYEGCSLGLHLAGVAEGPDDPPPFSQSAMSNHISARLLR